MSSGSNSSHTYAHKFFPHKELEVFTFFQKNLYKPTLGSPMRRSIRLSWGVSPVTVGTCMWGTDVCRPHNLPLQETSLFRSLESSILPQKGCLAILSYCSPEGLSSSTGRIVVLYLTLKDWHYSNFTHFLLRGNLVNFIYWLSFGRHCWSPTGKRSPCRQPFLLCY